MKLFNSNRDNLDLQELEIVYDISRIVAEAQSVESTLDDIINLARKVFIFDNIVLYEPISNHQLEPVYPRAIGRGRYLGADLVWGENIAQTAYDENQITIHVEDLTHQGEDRTNIRHYLGIPLRKGDTRKGVLIFIRFGGPPYLDDQIRIAEYIADFIAQLLERRNLVNQIASLEASKKLEILQDEFIAMFSHELLSPLGTIKGYTTTLLRENVDWDEAERRNFLEVIYNESNRLQNLIEVILDSSQLQIGAHALNLEPVKIDTLLDGVVQKTKILNNQLEIDIQQHDNIPEIMVDPTRIEQVFENIIANAEKYAPGSPIHIKFRIQDTSLNISFSDFGPGIPKDQTEKIFDRFYRVPDPQFSSVQGSGLGLFICSQIIKAHKGTITAETNIGSGMTINICFPLELNSNPELASNSIK